MRANRPCYRDSKRQDYRLSYKLSADMKSGKSNEKMQARIDARRRHGLSHAEVQMAHELGMNPKKLGKLIFCGGRRSAIQATNSF